MSHTQTPYAGALIGHTSVLLPLSLISLFLHHYFLPHQTFIISLSLNAPKYFERSEQHGNSYHYKQNTPSQTSVLINFTRMSTHYATQSKAVKISHQNYASIITTLHLSLQYDVDSINYQGNIPLFLPHSSISITLTSEPLQFAAYFSGSHLSPHSYSIKKAKECTPISLSLSSTKLYNAPFSSAEFLSALQLCHNTHEGPDGIHYHIFHLPPTSLSYQLRIFNNTWTTGNFP